MARDTALAERRQGEDLNPRAILLVALGTLGLLFAAVTLCWLFERLSGLHGPSGHTPGSFVPPRLQSDPAGELRDYQAAGRARLAGYGWADRERGLVRIPIARAMDLVAARGAEAYAPLDPPRVPDPRR
ncbi:hypothetical protein JYK14_17600 [Siccirubricoccus sp. KC 17139]|uniref:Uncharacterized protein n=1 Tax=Siccirubricoccus soli TaxID=2899147 RepID=A0ABT1DAF2_9PROT|nr:hypothetical protein [Siccirubricoccus soli]MCO6417960.1 hypothetical protein [Siccirubricoccus soli]MCP2684095.1 hypothetical protein [Siccirubricoccus soli]